MSRRSGSGSVVVHSEATETPMPNENVFEPTTPPVKATAREWLGLCAIALPCLVVVMDLTVLHLAVPTLTRALRPSPSQLLWIVDIYGFLLAGSLITMGTLGDRIGRRRLLLIGAGAFAAASVLAAFAHSAAMLIAARAGLGVAGATLAPSTLALIRNMFHDPIERTAAVGVWGTSFAAGSALGPPLGGFLLEHFWWGAVFLVPVPVMTLLLVVGRKLLPEFRDPNPGRLDLVSAAISLGAVLSTIYGLKRVAEDGFGPVPVVAMAAGVLLGVTFIRRQRRLPYPLIDLALFRSRTFRATVIILSLNALVMFASSFFNTQYFQLVLGLSPFKTGLWTLSGAISVTVSSMLSPKLVGWAPRFSVLTGCLLVCALGFAILALVGYGGLPFLVVGSIVTTLGAGPIGTLSSETVVSAAPPERAGSAASISETSAECGGALGIAVLGSVGVVVYRMKMAAALPGGIARFAAASAHSSLAGAVAAAHEMQPEAGTLLLKTARAAFASGFVLVAAISSIVMVLAAVLMFVAARKQARRGAPGGETCDARSESRTSQPASAVSF
jgi:DHA2 family multidrug resistance protein-like MFS transporter